MTRHLHRAAILFVWLVACGAVQARPSSGDERIAQDAVLDAWESRYGKLTPACTARTYALPIADLACSEFTSECLADCRSQWSCLTGLYEIAVSSDFERNTAEARPYVVEHESLHFIHGCATGDIDRTHLVPWLFEAWAVRNNQAPGETVDGKAKATIKGVVGVR